MSAGQTENPLEEALRELVDAVVSCDGNSAVVMSYFPSAVAEARAALAAHREQPPEDALRQALNDALDAVVWMSGSPSFGPDGEAHEGWVTIRESLGPLFALAAVPAAHPAAEEPTT